MTNVDLAVAALPGSSAAISPCGTYRYRLERSWAASKPFAAFVMLNPSTADATDDDPTIRRCIGFARTWGHGGLVVVNLYAYRATNPAELRGVADPVGPDNDEHLRTAFAQAAQVGGPVVAAWGTKAGPDRVRKVAAMAERFVALRVTKNGHPGHPLYVPAAATPVAWGAHSTTD